MVIHIVFVLNIYIPCDDRYIDENLFIYQDILYNMSLICESNNVQYVIICDDLNTDFNHIASQTSDILWK